MPKQQKQPKPRAASAPAPSAPSDFWEDAKLQAELDEMILENAAIAAAKEAEQKAEQKAVAPPPSPPPPPPAPPVVKVRRCCQKCQGDNPTLMCPLCKTYYCSAACQAAHWPLHKDKGARMAGYLDGYAIGKARVKDREGDVNVRCFYAVMMGRPSDCERIILEERPDLNFCVEPGFTTNSVHAAAENGHARLVALLLRHGGRADVYSSKGATPFSIAAENGHELVVQTLLEHGVEVDAQNRDALGGAALCMAAQNGHASIVKLLLAAGAVVDLPRSDSRTSLFMAAQLGHVKVVRLLLRAGAEPLRPTSVGGFTPLHVATLQITLLSWPCCRPELLRWRARM